MKKAKNQVAGQLIKNMLNADMDFVNWLITQHDLGKDYVFGDGPFNSKGLLGTYDEPYNHKHIDTGPFYALFIKLFHENAVGGMATDSDLRVLKQDQPIAGLYAAGDNICGIMLPGEIGVAHIVGVLSALTVAFSSGYLAGEKAIEFCK